VRFQIARGARKTGTLLQNLVAEELGGANPGGLVCYGVGYAGTAPALNARCSAMNKLQQARALRTTLGENAIRPLTLQEAAHACDYQGINPMLGRNIRHAQGKDIRLCIEPWQVRALDGISDFFTPYLPSAHEYRVWVYRKRHLGTYRKILKEATAMKRVGRNHDNGFRFERMELAETPEPLKEIGRKAIAALGLDFGAVDVIEMPSGRLVVLEVNSAPGVADGRRAVIQKLAHRIARWAQEGHPHAAA
jgi:hypothetical protein